VSALFAFFMALYEFNAHFFFQSWTGLAGLLLVLKKSMFDPNAKTQITGHQI
jgi:hypothetical protein